MNTVLASPSATGLAPLITLLQELEDDHRRQRAEQGRAPLPSHDAFLLRVREGLPGLQEALRGWEDSPAVSEAIRLSLTSAVELACRGSRVDHHTLQRHQDWVGALLDLWTLLLHEDPVLDDDLHQPFLQNSPTGSLQSLLTLRRLLPTTPLHEVLQYNDLRWDYRTYANSSHQDLAEALRMVSSLLPLVEEFLPDAPCDAEVDETLLGVLDPLVNWRRTPAEDALLQAGLASFAEEDHLVRLGFFHLQHYSLYRDLLVAPASLGDSWRIPVCRYVVNQLLLRGTSPAYLCRLVGAQREVRDPLTLRDLLYLLHHPEVEEMPPSWWLPLARPQG